MTEELLKLRFTETLTIREAYNAMLKMLETYYNLVGQDERAIVDIFDAGYIHPNGNFLDAAFFEYYLDAVDKEKNSQ